MLATWVLQRERTTPLSGFAHLVTLIAWLRFKVRMCQALKEGFLGCFEGLLGGRSPRLKACGSLLQLRSVLEFKRRAGRVPAVTRICIFQREGAATGSAIT